MRSSCAQGLGDPGHPGRGLTFRPLLPHPQISTRQEDLGETVCSLKFAERVGSVELGPARRRKATGSRTPSSLSTDTALTGTPCTPTPCPGSSPPSPDPDSGPSSACAQPEDLPA